MKFMRSVNIVVLFTPDRWLWILFMNKSTCSASVSAWNDLILWCTRYLNICIIAAQCGGTCRPIILNNADGIWAQRMVMLELLYRWSTHMMTTQRSGVFLEYDPADIASNDGMRSVLLISFVLWGNEVFTRITHRTVLLTGLCLCAIRQTWICHNKIYFLFK